MTSASIEQIYNVRVVDERLTTAGQPTAAQLRSIAASGFDVVINLALHDDPRYALPGEQGLVQELGMQYVHIPVVFSAPQPEELQAFCAAMQQHAGKKLFVHCAANYRVSAFVGLYHVLHQGWQRDAAFAQLHGLWQPDAVWQGFIDRMLQGEG